MFYVTQGHEQGIGLEVFLKGYITLPYRLQRNFKLIVEKSLLQDYLKKCHLPFSIENNNVFIAGNKLEVEQPESNRTISPSLASINKSLKLISPCDVLVTLPTAKDQFSSEGNRFSGHTEYFRAYYKNDDIVMNFINDREHLVLLTDHMPLKEVPRSIKKETILNKIKYSIEGTKKYLRKDIETVVFAGINPHAGENGRLGDEENEIKKAIVKLKKDFPNISFIGPISGDALHQKQTPNCLKVYSAHDQALSYFKGKYGFWGLNITFGLPFLRISVDHGTAFDLQGHHQVNYVGALFQNKFLASLNS